MSNHSKISPVVWTMVHGSLITWLCLLILHTLWSSQAVTLLKADEEESNVENQICPALEPLKLPVDRQISKEYTILRKLHTVWTRMWRGSEAGDFQEEFHAIESHASSDTAAYIMTRRRLARSSQRPRNDAVQVSLEGCRRDDNTQDTSMCPTLLSEPNVGMTLEVYEGKNTLARYELMEPLDLELGLTVQHSTDYAYKPVVTNEIEPSLVGEELRSPEKPLVQGAYTSWWDWWLPWRTRHARETRSSHYRILATAFAGGSHGQVWRGRRKCRRFSRKRAECSESLVFKRLKVEHGYRILEAGLREVYFGSWLSQYKEASMYTQYVDHFFRESSGDLELWIVFKDAGMSLRSYLYEGSLVGDYLIYQHSFLWTQLRMSLSGAIAQGQRSLTRPEISSGADKVDRHRAESRKARDDDKSVLGRQLMGTVLREILEAAAFLHENDVIHRDIKPSNILCETNLDWETFRPRDLAVPLVKCVLGDFSSAWNQFTHRNLYTKGPSRSEQTDDYAPPEAIFGDLYNNVTSLLTHKFDSWSIGIVALELLLGTPNVFTVDQRTQAILRHKMEKLGAKESEIKHALYLAALSQFCIYNPTEQSSIYWLFQEGSMEGPAIKESCTINDFHRALRARDPLGVGFDSSADTLLHLIWKLLEWDPELRILPLEALQHTYFTRIDPLNVRNADSVAHAHKAVEDQMLDPRMDFNLTDTPSHFECPKCGKVFGDWMSCQQHARARQHANFCVYNTSTLPTCLNAHRMLPSHYSSGYCDIQGRRRFIEDFHSVHLLPSHQYYAIFDGHTGNLASKFAASVLYQQIIRRLHDIDEAARIDVLWKERSIAHVANAFTETHKLFLDAVARSRHGFMDQSGTTATAMLITSNTVLIASLGDSRAVASTTGKGGTASGAIQLTTDHTAENKAERRAIEDKGGYVEVINGIPRVNGTLVITRSIGDANLSPILSQTPEVNVFTKSDFMSLCGANESSLPCFVILASDGLFEKVSNVEAVTMVNEILSDAVDDGVDWQDTTAFQRAAEALTQEAFVRGSTDNIGVCVVAIE